MLNFHKTAQESNSAPLWTNIRRSANISNLCRPKEHFLFYSSGFLERKINQTTPSKLFKCQVSLLLQSHARHVNMLDQNIHKEIIRLIICPSLRFTKIRFIFNIPGAGMKIPEVLVTLVMINRAITLFCSGLKSRICFSLISFLSLAHR